MYCKSEAFPMQTYSESLKVGKHVSPLSKEELGESIAVL